MWIWLVIFILCLIMFSKYSNFDEQPRCSIVVKIENGVPSIEKINDDYESRGTLTFKHIQKVYEKHGDTLKQKATMCISADDVYRENVPYQIVGGHKIPCWSFIHWDEAGLPRFFSDFYHNYKPEPFESKEDSLFWIGNLGTHPSRHTLKNEFGTKPGYKIYGNGEIPYTSMEDHGKYKYLIDVTGRGYSGRMKYLLMLNSVLFIAIRDNVEYWFDSFEPWVHYVPVKGDFSDLEENYSIMKNDQDKCKTMAAAARTKALDVFNEDTVYEYYASLLRDTMG